MYGAIAGAREIAVRLVGKPPFESGLHLDSGWLIPISFSVICHNGLSFYWR